VSSPIITVPRIYTCKSRTTEHSIFGINKICYATDEHPSSDALRICPDLYVGFKCKLMLLPGPRPRYQILKKKSDARFAPRHSPHMAFAVQCYTRDVIRDQSGASAAVPPATWQPRSSTWRVLSCTRPSAQVPNFSSHIKLH